jgi:hypothetical protein
MIRAKNKLFKQYVDMDYLSLLKVGQPTSYAQITKLMFFVFHSKAKIKNINKISTLIDKHPFYTYHVEKILSVFPEAKFIALVRDYRAFVLSNRKSKQPYQVKLSVFYFATVWKYYVKRIFSDQQKFPSHILLVKYEDWVNKNENSLEQMLTHFRLEQKDSLAFSNKRAEAILNWFKENPTIYLSPRDINVLKNLSNPINTSKTNAWKEKLSPVEIKKCDYISGKTGKKLAYFPQYNKIGKFQATWFWIASLTGRIRVATFFFLNSIKIQHFLTIKIRIIYLNRIKKSGELYKNTQKSQKKQVF